MGVKKGEEPACGLRFKGTLRSRSPTIALCWGLTLHQLQRPQLWSRARGGGRQPVKASVSLCHATWRMELCISFTPRPDQNSSRLGRFLPESAKKPTSASSPRGHRFPPFTHVSSVDRLGEGGREAAELTEERADSGNSGRPRELMPAQPWCALCLRSAALDTVPEGAAREERSPGSGHPQPSPRVPQPQPGCAGRSSSTARRAERQRGSSRGSPAAPHPSASSHMLFTRAAARLLRRAACRQARSAVCWERAEGWAGASRPGGDGLQQHVNLPRWWQRPAEPQSGWSAGWARRAPALYRAGGKRQRVEGER